MPFRFNQLLVDAGIDPRNVRLLRHQADLGRGRTLLNAWRGDRGIFEEFQSLQLTKRRSSFARPYWATFLGTWDGRTLYAGVYAASSPVIVAELSTMPLLETLAFPGTLDRFQTSLTDHLAAYSGRLYIEWSGGSSGKRSWNQRADAQNKLVTELHLDVAEQPFPGFMSIASPLSTLAGAAPGWIQRLSEGRGVYLLACPRTGEMYVGSAKGTGGFWSRWLEYRRNGHGGNVALIGRQPTDWTVSVLQVAGSADSADDILAMEATWKVKLQAREFGLSRN